MFFSTMIQVEDRIDISAIQNPDLAMVQNPDLKFPQMRTIEEDVCYYLKPPPTQKLNIKVNDQGTKSKKFKLNTPKIRKE